MSTYDDHGPTNREVVLEALKVGSSMHVAKELLNDPEFMIDDFMADHIRIMMKGFLYGRTPGEKIIEYPADWVQAFKLRWFPAWLLARFPARMTVHHLKFYEIYPEFKMERPPFDVRVPLITDWIGS